MAFGEDLKEEFGTLFGKGHIPQLIEHQESNFGIALDGATEGFAMARLDQFIGQTAAGDKAGRYPLATGGHPQPPALFQGQAAQPCPERV